MKLYICEKEYELRDFRLTWFIDLEKLNLDLSSLLQFYPFHKNTMAKMIDCFEVTT